MRFRFARSLRGIAFVSLLVACGSRTGLFTVDTPEELPLADAGQDGSRRDSGFDGDFPDALPPLDVQPPTDVNRNDCPDADSTYVYLVGEGNELYSFYPPDASFRFIGNLACPTADPGATPFSMAVDRKGKAYVVFSDGELFNVSTLTAACISTAYVPNQQGFSSFGMGFATIGAGPDEALFLANDPQTTGGNGASALGRLEIPQLTITRIGNFSPQIRGAEFTGTGDGRLFAFYNKTDNNGPSFIGEINTSTGAVIGEKFLPGVSQGSGWAFGFWGGDFYTFTSADGATSNVTRYRPMDDTVTDITTLPARIVRAGVSTCAPQQ